MSPTFRALRNPNYRRYLAGSVVSNTGTWMQRVAQDWLVLQLPGNSGTALGITTGLQFLPALLLLGGEQVPLQGKALSYNNVLDACLKVTRCKELTTWGFSDRFSWVPASFPGFGRALPFDLNYQPKPAFNALLARLGAP